MSSPGLFSFLLFIVSASGAIAQEHKVVFLEKPPGLVEGESTLEGLDQKIEETRGQLADLSEEVLSGQLLSGENRAIHEKEKYKEYQRLQRLLASLEDRRSTLQEHADLAGQRPGERLDLRDLVYLFWSYHVTWDRYVQMMLNEPVRSPTGQEWEQLAHNFDKYMNFPFSLADRDTAPFMLRAFLVQGQCYLNGARAYLHEGNPGRHLVLHDLGIRRLHRVLQLCHQARQGMNTASNFDFIEGDEDSLKERVLRDVPRSDYTTMEWEEHYFRIALYAGTRLENQQPTSETAKKLLAEYCPWGVETYFMLKNAFLAQGLDFHILPTYYSVVPIWDKRAPKVSVLTLSEDQLPVNVKQRARAMIGTGYEGQVVVNGNPEPIEWAHVGSPLYTVWYVSPVLFQMKPSEVLTWIMRFLTLGKLDLVAYATRFMDEMTTWITGQLTKGGKGLLYVTIQMAGHTFRGVGANKHILNHVVQRLGFEGAEIKTGRVAVWGIARRVVSLGLKLLETWERQYLFEFVNPESLRLTPHLSYDGTSRLTPVILRTMITGYKKTPPFEYRCLRTIVTYHILNPRAVYGGKGVLDLSKVPLLEDQLAETQSRTERYAAGDAAVQEEAWRLLRYKDEASKRHDQRIIEMDFRPKSQVFRIKLDPLLFHDMQRSDDGKEHTVAASLYTPDDVETPLIDAEIKDAEVVLQLFDEEKNPDREGEVDDAHGSASTILRTVYNFKLARKDGSGEALRRSFIWVTFRHKDGKLYRQTGTIIDNDPAFVEMHFEPKEPGIAVHRPNFTNDLKWEFGWLCDAVVSPWPPELDSDLYRMEVEVKGMGTYYLYAYVPASSKEARFRGCLPLPKGEVEMKWSLPKVQGVEANTVMGHRVVKREKENQTKFNEKKKTLDEYTKKLQDPNNPAPKPAVHAQLGMTLGEMAKIYNDSAMYDWAIKAANESLGQLNQSSDGFRNGAFRCQALLARAVSAYAKQNRALFESTMLELAEQYQMTAEGNNSKTAWTTLVDAFNNLAEYLLLSGADPSKALAYYERCVMAANRGRVDIQQVLDIIKGRYPNLWAVYQASLHRDR